MAPGTGIEETEEENRFGNKNTRKARTPIGEGK
jgi:hypothetical protein